MSALELLASSATPQPKRIVASPLAASPRGNLMPLPQSPGNVVLFQQPYSYGSNSGQKVHSTPSPTPPLAPNSRDRLAHQQQQQQLSPEVVVVEQEVQRRLSHEREQRDADEEQFLQELNAHVQELNEGNRRLTQENAELRESVESFEHEKAQLMQHHRTLTSSVQELTEEVDRERAQAARMEVSLCHKEDQSKRDRNSVSMQILQLEKELNAEQRLRLDAEAKCGALDQKCDSLEKKIFEGEEKASASFGTFEKLKAEAEEKGAAVEKLRSLLTVARSELENCQHIIEAKNEEIRRSASQAKSAQHKAKELTSGKKLEEEQTHGKIEELESKVKHQTDELRKKAHKFQNLEKEMANIREALAHSIAEYQGTKTKLDTVTSSLEELASKCCSGHHNYSSKKNSSSSSSNLAQGMNPLMCTRMVQDAFSELAEEKQTFQKQLRHTTSSLDKAKAQLEEQTQLVEAKDKKMSDLERSIQQLSSSQDRQAQSSHEIERISADLQHTTNTLETQKDRVKALEKELAQSQFSQDEAQGTVEVLTRELKETHEQMRSVKKNAGRSKEGEKELLSLIKALRGELVECQNETVACMRDRDTAVRGGEEANEMKVKLHRRTVKLGEDLKKKTLQLTEKEEAHSALLIKMKEMEQRLSRRSDDTSKGHSKIQHLEQEVAGLREQLHLSRQETDEARVELHEAQQRHDNYVTSLKQGGSDAKNQLDELRRFGLSILSGSLSMIARVLQVSSPSRHSVVRLQDDSASGVMSQIDSDIKWCLELARDVTREHQATHQAMQGLQSQVDMEKDRTQFVTLELESVKESYQYLLQQQQSQQREQQTLMTHAQQFSLSTSPPATAIASSTISSSGSPHFVPQPTISKASPSPRATVGHKADPTSVPMTTPRGKGRSSSSEYLAGERRSRSSAAKSPSLVVFSPTTHPSQQQHYQPQPQQGGASQLRGGSMGPSVSVPIMRVR